MKGRFNFKPLLQALEFWAIFFACLVLPAVAVALCVTLPIILAIKISWQYLFLYLVTIPIVVGIILFMCYTKEEESE